MRSVIRRTGRGEAGFTLLDMLFVCALIGLLSSLALPVLVRARGAAQASSAIGSLRLVGSAQLSFAITCATGFYSPDLPTLGVPPPGSTDAFLPPDLTVGPTIIKSGYTLSLAGTAVPGSPASCNGLPVGGGTAGYAAVADPLAAGPTARFFGTNADGVMYEDSATLSLTMPETGPPPAGTPLK
jgi:type II secretory pathway pseudopilin PulG